MTRERADAGGQGQVKMWWLARDGQAVGPYPESEVQCGLRNGAVSPRDLTCPNGGTVWRALNTWPEFFPATAAEPPASPNPPWNPRAIAVLGLLASPFWAAGMAAANARRLGGNLHVWRPILVALGGFTLVMVLETLLTTEYMWVHWLTDLSLYLATVGMIWRLDLRTQYAVYLRSIPPTPARWWWPAILATPLSLYVLAVFVLGPLTPSTPVEVARAFLGAADAATARQHATPRLWPAVEAMVTAGGESPGSYQLTFEREGEAGSHTYFVGYVLYVQEGGQTRSIDGSLRLVDYDGSWKVDELFMEAVDSRTLERPIVASVDFPAQAAAALPPPPQQVAAAAPPPQLSAANAYQLDGRRIAANSAGPVAHAVANSLAHEEGVLHTVASFLAKASKLLLAAVAGAIAIVVKSLASLLRNSKPAVAPTAVSEGGAPGATDK